MQKKFKSLLIGRYTQYNDCYDSSKIVNFRSLNSEIQILAKSLINFILSTIFFFFNDMIHVLITMMSISKSTRIEVVAHLCQRVLQYSSLMCGIKGTIN